MPVRARGKSDSKTDRRPDRKTHRRIVQNHFSRRFEGCTSQIRSYLEVDFLQDANTSIDMEVISRLSALDANCESTVEIVYNDIGYNDESDITTEL